MSTDITIMAVSHSMPNTICWTAPTKIYLMGPWTISGKLRRNNNFGYWVAVKDIADPEAMNARLEVAIKDYLTKVKATAGSHLEVEFEN